MTEIQEGNSLLRVPPLLYSGRLPEVTPRAPSTPLRYAQKPVLDHCRDDQYSLGASPAGKDLQFKEEGLSCADGSNAHGELPSRRGIGASGGGLATANGGRLRKNGLPGIQGLPPVLSCAAY